MAEYDILPELVSWPQPLIEQLAATLLVEILFASDPPKMICRMRPPFIISRSVLRYLSPGILISTFNWQHEKGRASYAGQPHRSTLEPASLLTVACTGRVNVEREGRKVLPPAPQLPNALVASRPEAVAASITGMTACFDDEYWRLAD